MLESSFPSQSFLFRIIAKVTNGLLPLILAISIDNSLNKQSKIPVFSIIASISLELFFDNIFLISSPILSFDTFSSIFLFSIIASSKSLSKVLILPSPSKNRKARIILNPSSAILSPALPTDLRIFCCKSFFPPNMSIMFQSSSTAIAFIVKSRRAKSSSILSPNNTLSGLLPSP